jgi:iron-sulfur cluster assembly protein
MTEMNPTSPTPTSPAPKAKRPRPQVMRLTEAAAERIVQLTKRADSEIVGLRVGVKNGGCAGQSYTVEYAHEVRPTDEVVVDKGVKILVDPKAVLFLLGTEMDYKADKMQAQFIFNNPNQIGACGCGESVQLKPAEIDG